MIREIRYEFYDESYQLLIVLTPNEFMYININDVITLSSYNFKGVSETWETKVKILEIESNFKVDYEYVLERYMGGTPNEKTIANETYEYIVKCSTII